MAFWKLRPPLHTQDARYPPSRFVSRCSRTPCPTTRAPTWPPGGSYLLQCVERHRLALETFVVDCDRFLDCRTFSCSTRTFTRARIWNPTKYRAFKFFWFSSRKTHDCSYSKTTTELGSLLTPKIRQILIRFLAKPQPYI
jgi:hypothetical protein